MTSRSGYHDCWDNLTNHYGYRQEHSGRVNLTRMDAESDSLKPLSQNDGIMHSSTHKANLEDMKAMDHPQRNTPSLISERCSRGYNPSYFGYKVDSPSSSPQLGGRELGYRG